MKNKKESNPVSEFALTMLVLIICFPFTNKSGNTFLVSSWISFVTILLYIIRSSYVLYYKKIHKFGGISLLCFAIGIMIIYGGLLDIYILNTPMVLLFGLGCMFFGALAFALRCIDCLLDN